MSLSQRIEKRDDQTNFAMARLELARRSPLDFTLQYPPRREYFQDRFRGQGTLPAGMATDGLLYMHVPFCASKCYYCNFAVDIRTAPDIHGRYVDHLVDQSFRLADHMAGNWLLHGIDIGGGTPTLLSVPHLQRMLQALDPWRTSFAINEPLSIETTPDIAAHHPERLEVLRAGGITRISMGVQSDSREMLAAVNRGLQIGLNEQAMQNMRAAKFKRINADVIFGLPQQGLKDWQKDLAAVIDLRPDSITTYDCLYRGKGRALTKMVQDRPTQQQYAALYNAGYEQLKDAGYQASYGSVNFSRHVDETGVSPYFERRLLRHFPYLGLGNYSTSQFRAPEGEVWLFAPHGVTPWQNRVQAGDILPSSDLYVLPQNEIIAKQVLLSLSFGEIDVASINHRFGIDFEKVYEAHLAAAIQREWLTPTPTGYGMPYGKYECFPQLRSLFYTHEAIQWLRNLPEDRPIAQPVRRTTALRF